LNANLFGRDLRRNLKRLSIWTVSIVALNVFTAAMYESIAGDATSVAAFLEMYPKSLTKAFGMDASSWSNVLGFYTTYFIFYVLLSGGVFAVTFGMDILAGEESRKTAEFLYTKPLTRSEIYWTKCAVLVTHVTIFNLVVYLTAWPTLSIVDPGNVALRNLTILHLYGLLFCLLWSGIGLFVASIAKRGRTSLFAGIGVVMLMYFYDAIMKTTDSYDSLGYFTPYRFVPMDVTSPGYGFSPAGLIYFLGIFAVAIAAGAFQFSRKDIYT